MVNTTTDEDTPGDGLCSLREAIINSNLKTGAGSDCGPAVGHDTIKFSVSGTITLGSALPAIENTLAIDGTGQTITIDGSNSFQVFSINSSAQLSLNKLTVKNGIGGAVNAGELTITNSTFSNNVAPVPPASIAVPAAIITFGGAINDTGSLFLTTSTFSGNTAAVGGAIFAAGGIVGIESSTFSGNAARISGGAIDNAGASVTVTNSTFANNNGGAIESESGGTSVNSSTFSGNQGPALDVTTPGTLTVRGSILSQNVGGDCSPTKSASDLGYNIADDVTCGFLPSSGTHGQSLGDNIDPKLDPTGLQDNGGPTKTIALEPTSPAIDAIPISSNLCPSTDQRGNLRPEAGESGTPACDSGAFESSEPPTPTPTPTPTHTPTPTATFTPTPVPEKIVVAGSGNFGSVFDGHTKTRHYRIKNMGTKKTGHSVTITSESIVDTTTMASPFSLLNMCAQVLVPGQSCGVAVKCAPTDSDTSTHTAILDVFDNAAGSPQTVNLECTAKAPRGKAADEENTDYEGVVLPEEAQPSDE
jgi:CSLREA domain-containing protein